MDEDDEFGDLYTDVLRPLSLKPFPSFVNPSPNPASPSGSDAIPVANPSFSHPIDPLVNATEEDPKDDWLPDNWSDGDDDGVPVPNFSRKIEPRVLEEPDGVRVSGLVVGNTELGVIEGFRVSDEEEKIKIGGMDKEPVIPGLSTVSLSSNMEMKVSNCEDWDSDSEDDLQIVLNDNTHGPMVGERKAEDEDDDGEEDLIIVTDEDQQHHHLPVMEEQEWGEGELQSAAEGESKEGLDAAKANGAVGTVAGTTRIGYTNHGFHPQHHSVFKYVRPGAPVVGPIAPPSQIHPPSTVGSFTGRGRGDWRPSNIRPGASKYLYSGYGPGWTNSSSRPSGGGLDFTLPSYKTVFDVDIGIFEDKPWRHPGIDISDYFNFGFDEDNWKEYCKQLDQLRLESTMQSKINVYESGRSAQEYDPDLPPELAAATGHHEISDENILHRKIDNGQSDLSGQEKGIPSMRAPFPPGRAIQVETGYSERLPSIDTRPPRIRDADAIIEIVLQDYIVHNGAEEQSEKDTQLEQIKETHDAEGDRRSVPDYFDSFQQTSNGRRGEIGPRRIPYESEGDGTMQFSPQSPLHYHSDTKRSPFNPFESFGVHRGGRLTERSLRGRTSSPGGANLDDIIPARSAQANQQDSDQEERQGSIMEGNHTPEPLPCIANENAGDLSIEQNDGEHDDMLGLGDSVEAEGEETSGFQVSRETLGEDSMLQIPKKQKLSSRVEKAAVQINGDDYDDDLRATHSEDGRAKSGSSNRKRHGSGHEEVEDGRSRRAGDVRRHHGEEEQMFRPKYDNYGRESRRETDKNHTGLRGREAVYRSYPHRSLESSPFPVGGRSEVFERSRETDGSFGQRKDHTHSRRMKDEDIRRERNGEIGSRNRGKVRVTDRSNREVGSNSKKRLDDRDVRGSNREGGPRLRERDDALSRRETLDEHQIKRRVEVQHSRGERTSRENSLHSYRAKEESTQRKRERDDDVDHSRRKDSNRIRARTEDLHSSKHKDESWREREREDRQQLKQSHEDSPLHREREEEQGSAGGGRALEDKTFGSRGRYKIDSKDLLVSDKDYQHRQRERRGEHLKRDRASEEKYPQLKGREEVQEREKHYSNRERNSCHERLGSHIYRPSNASDNQQMFRERHSEDTRKSKDIEDGQNSLGLGKRKHDDLGPHLNEKVVSKVTSEMFNEEQPESREKHEEELASDDESQRESKRGRSKLERWTGHKERSYSTAAANEDVQVQTSSSRGAKEVEVTDNGIEQMDELPKTEGGGNDDVSDGAAHQVAEERVGEDQDRHLDAVAKLKRRSERFKLPMPVEKDIAPSKRPEENEAQLTQQQNEAPADGEVKPERPARKRRWTGSSS